MLQVGPAACDSRLPNGGVAGWSMALAACTTVFMLASHPMVVAQASSDVLRQIVRFAGVDRFVHGVLIVMLGVLVFSFVVLSLRRGFHDQAVIGGIVAYGSGAIALVVAGAIDGFIAPAIASRFVGGSPNDVRLAMVLLTGGAITIDIFTRIGAIGMALGIGLTSMSLWRDTRALRRVAMVGFTAALVSIALLASAPHISPHTLIAVTFVQALWYVSSGMLLVRGRI